ncbi:MAG: hypothetical protein J2P48_19210 [Alphaproteobacteria bacterium]|nr:hypothetical protein [Alphaproteobacteria bacterium]
MNSLSLRIGAAMVCLAILSAGCAPAAGDASAGPNPGGGYFSGPNINVGQVNPPGFTPYHGPAQRP